jgi:BMFP domain-containing protein YqiC
MAKAQVEAMVQRLELVRREELDAALEVARRAREQAEALAERVQALEHRLAALERAEDAPGAPDEEER